MSQAELTELTLLLEELKKRKQHKSITYIPDDHPERNQKGFHQSKKRIRLLFGGNRSGKSRSAAQEIYWWATNTHPWIKTPQNPRIWVLSAEYRTLFEGIWGHLKDILPEWEISRIGPQVPGYAFPSFIEFKKGARIDFISAQGGGDETRKKLQAAEIDLLSIDEEISGNLWVELQFRLLTRGGKVVVSATLVESEEWLLELEDQANRGSEIVDLFRLNTSLNKYNDAQLFKELTEGLSEEEKIVRILGQRRKTSGLIYGNWFEKSNSVQEAHLCSPFPIPFDWTKIMCLDPGFRVCAALWVAISPNSLAVAYREMYLKFAELADAARFIKSAEDWEERRGPKEKILFRFIDSAAFRHNEDGSLGPGYKLNEDYGFDFCPSPTKDKTTNIDDVRNWLMPSRHHSANDLLIPKFRIFSTLDNFQSERRKYKIVKDSTDGDRPSRPDKPVAKADHLMNCWEYLASARIDFFPEEDELSRLRKNAFLPNDKVEYPEGKDMRMYNIRMRRERMKKKYGRN